MLPPGFERRVLTTLSPTNQDYDKASLNESQLSLLELLKRKPGVKFNEIETLLGKKRAAKTTSQLVELGFVERTYELEPVKVKTQLVRYVHLTVEREKAQSITENILKKAPKQAALLKILFTHTDPISLTEAKLKAGCDTATVNALVKKGLINIENVEVRREPLSRYQVQLSQPLNLTGAQEAVFKPIQASLNHDISDAKPSVFLLYGVTASGKTEIYLQALAEAVKLGKKGIALVPEIALTPQTIERFSARFPGRVAVLHSQLTLGEQFDEWQRIRKGEVDVVVGPRSALFAPQPDLGLIIIDEEHEWTYKQHEQSSPVPCQRCSR